MNKKNTMVGLFFRALITKAKAKIDKIIEAEPQQKSEAIDKFVYLLRRDFSITEQNEIILAVGKELHGLREKDIVEMTETLRIFEEQTSLLKSKILA